MIFLGTKKISCLADYTYKILSDSPVKIYHVEKDVIKNLIPGTTFVCKSAMEVLITTPDEFTNWDLSEYHNLEKNDPVPFEVTEGMQVPETLQEKMQRFLGTMVAERFGAQSSEMDTIEESMDFEFDDYDADLLSGYEVVDLAEEVIEPSPDLPEKVPSPPPPAPEDDGTPIVEPVVISHPSA